jgi:hypothetical protein
VAGETQAAELFKFDPADDLAAEHAAVLKHITDAMATLTQHSYHKEVPLNSLPSGQVLLGGGPKQSVRYLRAALQQVMFYDREADRMKAAAQGRSRFRAPAPQPADDRGRCAVAARMVQQCGLDFELPLPSQDHRKGGRAVFTGHATDAVGAECD